MEMIRLRYEGGRPQVKSNWIRKEYIFSKENDFTCDVPDGLAKELVPLGNYRVLPVVAKEESIQEKEEEIKEEAKEEVVKKKAVRPKKGVK